MDNPTTPGSKPDAASAPTDHLLIAGARKVEFLVSPRADCATVVVDGVERFRVETVTTGQIEFRYDLAAARSDDRHSYTIPPMQWGRREE